MAVVLPGSFIFLAHRHTGSEEVSQALLTIENAFFAINKRKGISHNATLDQVKRVAGDKLTGTEKVFTIVRNPYDILTHMFHVNYNHFQVRRFEERNDRDITMKEFVDLWVELNLPPYIVNGKIFYHDAQVHLRYERLQSDLDTLMRRTPGAPGSLPLPPLKDPPEKDHWTLFYDDATYTRVSELFRDEIVKFGYPFIWSNETLG